MLEQPVVDVKIPHGWRDEAGFETVLVSPYTVVLLYRQEVPSGGRMVCCYMSLFYFDGTNTIVGNCRWLILECRGTDIRCNNFVRQALNYRFIEYIDMDIEGIKESIWYAMLVLAIVPTCNWCSRKGLAQILDNGNNLHNTMNNDCSISSGLHQTPNIWQSRNLGPIQHLNCHRVTMWSMSIICDAQCSLTFNFTLYGLANIHSVLQENVWYMVKWIHYFPTTQWILIRLHIGN